MRGLSLFSRKIPCRKTLRNPRLNSTVVSVAVETFFRASRFAADRLAVMVEVIPEGGVARIFLNRPEKSNALSAALLQELLFSLEKINSIQNLRAVVLAGRGKAFCGGADVNELEALTPDTAPAFVMRIHSVCEAIRALPVPVVASLHGAC